MSSYRPDGSLVCDTSLGSLHWDRDARDQLGHHFNSVHRSGARIWVVAHNHDRPSEVWELAWPELEVVAIHRTRAAWAHNLWIGEHGLVICDSRFGRLQEALSGATLWAAGEDEVVTRGLAVNEAHVFVGRSEFGSRGDRRTSTGGVWILDRHTLQTLELIRFDGSGAVNEIRLIEGSDECHNGEPFDDALLGSISRGHQIASGETRLPRRP